MYHRYPIDPSCAVQLPSGAATHARARARSSCTRLRGGWRGGALLRGGVALDDELPQVLEVAGGDRLVLGNHARGLAEGDPPEHRRVGEALPSPQLRLCDAPDRGEPGEVLRVRLEAEA